MPEDDELPEQKPESKPDKGASEPPRRRASDQLEPPAWFTRWQAEQAKAPDKGDAGDEEGEDDGILSIEELPDLIEDAVEDAVDKGKELVESIPERTHFLFGKVFGKKG